MLSMSEIYRALGIVVEADRTPEISVCLELAVRQNRPDCIQDILIRLKELDIPELLGPPLATAVSQGKTRYVIGLLEKCPTHRRAAVIKRAGLLMLALEKGYPHMIRVVLDMCPKMDQFPLIAFEKNVDGITLLMAVIAKIAAIDKKDQKGRDAAINVLHLLLKPWSPEQRGSIIQAATGNGRTLMVAAQAGLEDVVRMLLEAWPLEQRALMITQTQLDGQSALSMADKENHMGCLLAMLASCPAESHSSIHHALEANRSANDAHHMVDEDLENVDGQDVRAILVMEPLARKNRLDRCYKEQAPALPWQKAHKRCFRAS